VTLVQPAVRSSIVATSSRTRIACCATCASPSWTDADGCPWVALWDGAAVHRHTPDGRRERRIAPPVSRPTSCAFGGRDRTTLFVTSARYGLDDRRLAAEPHAGAVLALAAGMAGTPEPGWAR